MNGHPHGPATGATPAKSICAAYNDGDTITVEPWRLSGWVNQRLDGRPYCIRQDYAAVM